MSKIRAGYITAVLQFVAGAGGHPARVRAAASLREGDLFDPERMLEVDRLAAVMAAAAEDLEAPAFGLRLGASFDLETLGLLTYAVLNAETVEVGVRNLFRYIGTVIDGIDTEIRIERGSVGLVMDLANVSRERARHLHEAGVMIVLRMLRHLVGDGDWRPTAIAFAHPAPDDVREHQRLLGLSPAFGAPVNEFYFDAAVLAREVPDTDRSLLPALELRLREVLLDEPSEEPWLRELRVQIASRLCDGHPNLADLAPRIGMSPRTLQRRLARRGIVYRDLVQRARQRLALRYLERSDTDLTEVAFLLGYSELSAFSHAFRRWTGRSPGAHRRAARR